MKVLHLSFHYGCISDVHNVLTDLGCDVTYQCMLNKLPYSIHPTTADQYWKENKEYINTFEIVITSDTVALSYTFLRNIAELVPHLIILNCNRFTYAMDNNSDFFERIRSVNKMPHKITYIPYTDFERVWCGINDVFLTERAIMPVGDYKEHIKDPKITLERFSTLDTSNRTKPQNETIFLQRYHNHHRFMDLAGFLRSKNVSVDFGSYIDITELKAYKAVVVLPDAFSNYFTFESIQTDLVVLLPTHRFLMELVAKPGYYFNIEGSGGRLTSNYVNLSEWFKYPESRIYFDSFDEMVAIINNLDDDKLAAVKGWCQFYGKNIKEEHTLQWKNILNKIRKHRGF